MSGTLLRCLTATNYHNRNLETVTWSTGVRDLFLPNSTPSASNPIPAGPIAGGVVGGLVVIALIGGLLWFMRRRRRRKTGLDGTSAALVEMENTQSPDGGKPSYRDQPDKRASEMHAGYLPSEMAASPDGTTVRYEVDGTSVAHPR